jgi:ech hydrogenase subunit A
MTNLIGISILFPFATGIACLAAKNQKVRSGIVFATAAVLLTAAVLMLTRGTFPFQLTVSYGWGIAIMVLDYGLSAYFLYLAIRDIRCNGLRLRNALTIGLVTAQLVMVSLLEFSLAPELLLRAEVEPTILADRLSLIMCLIINIIGSIICIYAVKYMADHDKHLGVVNTRQNQFFFYMIILLGAMNGIVFANNMLWIFFFWEVTTLCSFTLISYDGTPEAVENGFRALWMNLIGGLGFIIAMVLAWQDLGSLSLMDLISHPSPVLLMPLAFLFLAALTKSAQVPFQKWLLGAMIAPVPVSALLHSSTMVKAGVYLAIRTAPAFAGTPLSEMIAIFGGFTFVTTAILAIGQNEAKKVLAYSTISNLGLIMLCIGINTPLSITAAIVLIIFHAISKALLFLNVGIIEHSIRSRDIEDMQGLSRRLPLITGITIAGIVSMILIPFGALFGKWTAIEATGASSAYLAPLMLVFLVIGSAATTVFWVKWMGRLLSQSPSTEKVKTEPFSPVYHVPVLILIGGALVFSVMITPLYRSLIAPAVSSFYPLAITAGNGLIHSAIGAFASWPLFIALAVPLILGPLLVRLKASQTRAAYMCGENTTLSSPRFRSVADEETELRTGGMYLDRYLGNIKLDNSLKLVALAILVVLFVVVI